MTVGEDHSYIERVRNGDKHAYAYLVNKYKKMAYTVALKIVRNAEDAEDTTQESFIKAYQQIHSFKSESKFSTWLYTIVFRTAAYNLRKKQIVTRQINEEITESIADDDAVDQRELQELAQLKYVKEAIDNLPRLESLLITLFYMNENSVAEINKITGLSESNIKVKLYRARKKLKKQLNTVLETALNNTF